jgi:hypothetical protein
VSERERGREGEGGPGGEGGKERECVWRLFQSLSRIVIVLCTGIKR